MAGCSLRRLTPLGRYAVMLMLLLAAAARGAAAGDITIVAADSLRPVAGALGIFYWEQPIPGPDGAPDRLIHVNEVVSGDDGVLKETGLSAFILKSQALYIFKPGYRFKKVQAPYDSTAPIELFRVPTKKEERRAEAAACDAVIERIVYCRGAICHKNLVHSLDVISREFEFVNSSWIALTESSHGQVITHSLKTVPAGKARKRAASGGLQSKGKVSTREHITTLRQSSDYQARRLAAGYLGRAGARDGVDALISALADEHWEVRCATARALGKLSAEAAAPELVRVLGDPHQSVRMAAGYALAGLGAAASPALIGALSDPNPLAREGAARILVKTGGASAVNALIPVLNDVDADVRKRAAVTLGVLNDPRATDPLMTRLAIETAPAVKGAIFRSFERLRDPRVVESMTTIFLLEPKGAGRQAGRVLMAIEPDGVKALAAGLGQADPGVRSQAAHFLGMSRSRLATAPLIDAVTDKDFRVRYRVIQALGQIGDPAAIPALMGLWSHPDAGTRTRAAHAVVRHGRPALGELIGYLDSDVPYFRWRAAWALGNLSSPDGKNNPIRDPRGVAALIGALSDPALEVCWCAIRSLGALQARQAFQALEEIAANKDNGIRGAALDALEAIKDRR